MDWRDGAVGVLVLTLTGSVSWAQIRTGPREVEGYVATIEFSALAPGGQPVAASPETQAILGRLKSTTKVTTRVQLARAFSRVEIQSQGFVLPPGTLILHEAGARHYVIADPKAKTYVVMDAGRLIGALEGSLGVINSEYKARAHHTHEEKQIAGLSCRKAIVEVTFASSIPFENDRIVVAQKNEIEIWHTPSALPTAALEHLLFKFRQDRTGQVKKVLEADIGFPMEIRSVITPVSADAKQTPQPGSFEMQVKEIKIDRHLDPEIFRLPPAGYRQLERNPYFAAAAAGTAAQ